MATYKKLLQKIDNHLLHCYYDYYYLYISGVVVSYSLVTLLTFAEYALRRD